MKPDYPLEAIGSDTFEQLAVTLGLQVFGDQVQIFGAGPDGGREATLEGKITWSETEVPSDEVWNGYTVIQAKHCQTQGSPQQNHSWLRQQIKKELDAWVAPDSKRGATPDYLLFITNVRLSSTPEDGGIDRINSYLRERLHEPITGSKGSDSLALRGLKDMKVWHRDQLVAFLNKYDNIRNAFAGLLTVGDVLNRLHFLGGLLSPSDFQPVMAAHAKKSLIHERWVNFGEISQFGRESVDNIVIDLKAKHDETNHQVAIIEEVLKRAELVLKPSLESKRKHIVLTGQPGSGKSTISLFLAQMYRVSFTEGEALTNRMEEVHRGTKQAFERLGLTLPKNHRWPMRISLPHYADDLGPDGDITLMRWMSQKISERAEMDILANGLAKWLKHWPSIILLDGLDEVTAPEVRPRVIDAIEEFVEELTQDDADTLIVVTTRPTGYSEMILPTHFDQFNLDYLSEQSARQYGQRVISRRLIDAAEIKEQVLERFQQYASDVSMLRLMKTPLQVLIMTFILEQSGSLPTNKYELFSRYFDTVYSREISKHTNLSKLLTDHRRQITELHEAVGLKLQIDAETSSDSRSIMSKDTLRILTLERLMEVGHEPGLETDRFADRILQATTDRLVLLVPAEHEGVSFEIRSLQELMAARALSQGAPEQILARLHSIIPSPHWRNVLLFLAGKIFAVGHDYERDMVINSIKTFDDGENWPGWLCPVGPEVSANLLDDGIAVNEPKWRKQLTDITLRSLSGPMPVNLRAISSGLSSVTERNDLLHIRSELKVALAGMPRSRKAAQEIIRLGSFGSRIPAPAGKDKSEEIVESRLISDLIEEQVSALELEEDELDGLKLVLEEWRGNEILDNAFSYHEAESSPATSEDSLSLTIEALKDEKLNAILDLLFNALLPERWRAAPSLARYIWPLLSRSQVGPMLESQMSERSSTPLEPPHR